MDEEQVVKFVEAYLKKKGFKQAELAFQEEFQKQRIGGNNFNTLDISSDPDLSPFLSSLAQSDDNLGRYSDEYGKLRSWAYSSLDLYKHELLLVLYPVFFHCYMDLVAGGQIQEARTFFNNYREDHEMMHSRDLQKLEGVLSPTHLKEMEFAHSLRLSKVKIKICQYSNELLMQYLRKTKSTTILGIVNEHITFHVSPGQPSSISDDSDAVTLLGSSQDLASEINKKEIHWGLLEDSLENRLEKTGGLLSDSEKTEAETKDSELDENKKRAADGSKQGTSVKRSKKDKSGTSTSKVVRPETTSIPAAPRVKAELPLPVISTEVEVAILEDLRNRVQLSSTSLPSVSFYTFLNTYNGLNCSSISYDGSLLAGGFSDSSLKVFDMAALGQQSSNSVLQGDISAASNEPSSSPSGKKSYTLLQGHSGPVYSASFSPLGDYILSSSADTTVRLWSTKLNANLVCYKGHNYPVWDVQFSPFGHYFASASHDRTARIWSMDRIRPLRIIAGHLSDVDCVQWHANCNYIATGSSDKTVRLWDVQTGECVRVFIGHRCMVLSLALSPDGRYMASGDEDGTIMMWDLSNGRCITPLMGHSSCVWTLAFSGEGSLLASGSADCTLKLWDVSSSSKVVRTEDKNTNVNRLRLLKTLPTKSTPVYSLRFSRRNLLFGSGAVQKHA